MEQIEDALDSVGLMQGPLAPLKRTLVGGAIGYFVVTTAQPAFAYTKDGEPKEWAITSKNETPGATTMVPWWMAAAVPAFVMGVLI